MVVDAFVEESRGGLTWKRCAALDKLNDGTGPWSVPESVEIARKIWCVMQSASTFRVRVVDTAGVVVEQWPKKRAA
jgi:hypothetical protein